mmetsp:Transcript_41198/g.74595  ORF Transcript_41198/g.74595 Transcript_41198/m.74595 type:complete len:278 (+) Transcript_41198:796-1629(+)
MRLQEDRVEERVIEYHEFHGKELENHGALEISLRPPVLTAGQVRGKYRPQLVHHLDVDRHQIVHGGSHKGVAYAPGQPFWILLCVMTHGGNPAYNPQGLGDEKAAQEPMHAVLESLFPSITILIREFLPNRSTNIIEVLHTPPQDLQVLLLNVVGHEYRRPNADEDSEGAGDHAFVTRIETPKIAQEEGDNAEQCGRSHESSEEIIPMELESNFRVEIFRDIVCGTFSGPIDKLRGIVPALLVKSFKSVPVVDCKNLVDRPVAVQAVEIEEVLHTVL